MLLCQGVARKIGNIEQRKLGCVCQNQCSLFQQSRYGDVSANTATLFVQLFILGDSIGWISTVSIGA